MSVIGRLDKQVDDRLIAPVARRRGVPQGKAAAGDAKTDDNFERPVPRQSPPESAGNSAGQESVQTDELPVWLL